MQKVSVMIWKKAKMSAEIVRYKGWWRKRKYAGRGKTFLTACNNNGKMKS